MRCDEWPLTPIGDVARIFDGPHATPKPTKEGPIFLGIGNVTEEGRLDLSDIRHIAEEDFAQWTRRTTPSEGDVVFSYEASLHRYGLIQRGFHGCLGRRMALVRPQPDRLNSQFLLYYFLSPEWRGLITSNTLAGATVDRVPLTKFPEFPVRIPSLPTQHRIAAILSAYDDLIENHRKRIAILEDMARLLYREWFVHFRYPGHESVPLVDSPLGRIPQGWKASSLGRMCDNFDRKRRPLSGIERQSRPGPYRYYGAAKPMDSIDAFIFDGEYLLLAEDGSVITDDRRPMLQLVNEQFWPNNHTHILQGRVPVSTHFLYLALNCIDISPYITGAAQPKITQENMNRIPLVCATGAVHGSFDAMVGPMIQLVQNLEHQISALRRTRDLLLPRLMSGTLSVEALATAEAAAP